MDLENLEFRTAGFRTAGSGTSLFGVPEKLSCFTTTS